MVLSWDLVTDFGGAVKIWSLMAQGPLHDFTLTMMSPCRDYPTQHLFQRAPMPGPLPSEWYSGSASPTERGRGRPPLLPILTPGRAAASWRADQG